MTQLHTTFGLISSQIISVTSARFSPIITIILSQIIVKRNTTRGWEFCSGRNS